MKRRQFLASTAVSGGMLMLGGMGKSMAATSVPAWVSNLPLWQWYPIPGTALSSVDPAVRPLGVTGPRSKMETWCGATLKRNGSVYMLGAAGGHQDYAGNEVDALQLNSDNPHWVQLRGPSPNSQIIDDPAQFYLDLKPSCTHTYYATQYINSLDRMLVISSAGVYSHSGLYPAPPSNWAYLNSKRSFSFNTAAGDWDSPDYIAQYPGTGDWTACLCVKHPVTEDIYYSRNGGDGFYKWAAATNRWTKLSNNTDGSWYAGTAIDPTRNRLLRVGRYDNPVGEVRDLNGNLIPVTFGGLGASALAIGGYPGVIYDEVNDRFLVFYNAGNTINVLRVNPQTWFVDQPTFSGAAPGARPNGIQNSPQYVPELGGFVIANAYAGNVYFVRTTLTPMAAAPDTTPPPAPSGLTVS